MRFSRARVSRPASPCFCQPVDPACAGRPPRMSRPREPASRSPLSHPPCARVWARPSLPVDPLRAQRPMGQPILTRLCAAERALMSKASSGVAWPHDPSGGPLPAGSRRSRRSRPRPGGGTCCQTGALRARHARVRPSCPTAAWINPARAKGGCSLISTTDRLTGVDRFRFLTPWQRRRTLAATRR